MRKFTLGLMAALMLVAAANAATAYAPNGLARPYPFSGPDTLVMFDTAHPENYVTVGSMNVPNIGFGGMDFDRDGNLWAYASFYKSTGGAASGLYSVNMSTGQATLQGNSQQPLDDLAYNPTDDRMYGVRTQGSTPQLFTVDLGTGATSLVGTFTGVPAAVGTIGLAIDSQGTFFVHDHVNDVIYSGGSGLVMSVMYTLTQDTYASQGMTIDWSRDDMGYHGAVGQGVFPEYFSTVNTFKTDGSQYTIGSSFGPNEHFPGDQFGYPLVEPGDLAIQPVPEPATFCLLAMGLALIRRR